MSYSFDNLPTGFGAWSLGPQGVLPLAQAQGQLMANSYFPSIMRSLGFDADGDGVRQAVTRDDRYDNTVRDAQDAEADGGNVVWYKDKAGVPRRYGQATGEPWGITGRQAAEILRQRAAAYAPPTQQPQQPSYKAMSLGEFWGQ
jgi:hypothetical protein